MSAAAPAATHGRQARYAAPQAAEALGLTVRQVQRLRDAYDARGAAGFVSGRPQQAQQPSAARFAQRLRDRAGARPLSGARSDAGTRKTRRAHGAPSASRRCASGLSTQASGKPGPPAFDSPTAASVGPCSMPMTRRRLRTRLAPAPRELELGVLIRQHTEMRLQSWFLFEVVIAAACSADESARSVDAAMRDAGADSGSRDAAARCLGRPAPNPPDCPCGVAPSGQEACTQSPATICTYSGDCRLGDSIKGVSWTAQCIDGRWTTEWPDFCRENSGDESDAGSG